MDVREDYLNNGKYVELIEVLDDDYTKYCVTCTKEVYLDFQKKIVKPCEVSLGVSINDFNLFQQYVRDVNNHVNRVECSYCNQNNSYRLQGNKLWTTPGHGNTHVEIILDKTYNKKILEKHVKAIAKDYNRFACISITGDEPGLNIIEQNHIGLIAKPFFTANKLKNRRLRYDFRTSFNYSQERSVQIVEYMKKMKVHYPTLDINIQPTMYSVNNNFVNKINPFVVENFEIVVNSDIMYNLLKNFYHSNKNIKLPPGVKNI